MLNKVNGQDGHLCTVMIYMASFLLAQCKGNHPSHHFFNPHLSCLVIVDKVNGQNGHL